MKKIYIAGPMTGIPEWNFPAFDAAAAELRGRGFDVVNPAEVNPDVSMPWSDCLKRDIPEMLACDAIHALPGWEKSRGATLEIEIALRLGMPVVDYTTGREIAPSKAAA